MTPIDRELVEARAERDAAIAVAERTRAERDEARAALRTEAEVAEVAGSERDVARARANAATTLARDLTSALDLEHTRVALREQHDGPCDVCDLLVRAREGAR